MENFIEKLKTVDKKVWIGVGIGAAVVIILVVALIIGLGNSKPTGSNQGGSQNGTQAGTQTEGTEVFGSEGLGTEVIGTEMTTETEMGTETEVTESESQTTNESGLTVTQPESVGGVTQQPVTTKPDGEEILGAGSKNQPYLEIPDLSTMTLTTVPVPAGKALYYGIQRVGGMYLTINDPNAYVITSDGTRHDASNGKVSFKVENALASDYVMFQIGNKGGAATSFTIKFTNLQGSYQNPEKVATVGTYQKSLAAGNEIGYYYKYYAEQDGVLKFYVSGTKDSGISVTNNRNSANRTSNEDLSTDANGKQCVELEVKAGDEILILVHAQPDKKGRYPATDITWEMKY